MRWFALARAVVTYGPSHRTRSVSIYVLQDLLQMMMALCVCVCVCMCVCVCVCVRVCVCNGGVANECQYNRHISLHWYTCKIHQA